jgi:hypothetical protein
MSGKHYASAVTREKEPQYKLNTKLGELHGRSEKITEENLLPLLGFEHQIARPVAEILVFVHRQMLKVEERKYCMRCHIGLCKALDSVLIQVEGLTSRVKYATH